MAEELKTLDALGTATGTDTPVTDAAPTREAVRDEHGRSYATGKRKDATARV